ncbi:hypothetical protein C2S52_023066 [Perilla frutescens var. hirtella]|uniref:Uncharacterized protein n=1 Tax=Perilla frutescens var. hirtella TaxID=608512 RepID=A0AAD4J3U2_PERFH|nr:hypothetical protein C2S52_023066 [Perilla frutescens var. hirtella]KAH6808512.1 hypothetical protein C2S51_029620 [Perilla frutescens var. frutescens]KAH6826619.1 hypothetical protein C2S53_017146 [Perilla frutescens var. hirtella]
MEGGTGWPDLIRLDTVDGRGCNAAATSKAAKRRGRHMKRRKRVARYRLYGVEGRVKISISNGIRWLKKRCSEIIHGY